MCVPKATRYGNTDVGKCCKMNERDKKRQYNETIIRIEHDIFIALVSANGGFGTKCTEFYRLTELISVKRKENYSLIKSIYLCLRGSRSVFNYGLIKESVSADAKPSEKLSKINIWKEIKGILC